MKAKLFIEVESPSKGTIAESFTVVVPRVGEIIDISEAEKSKGFGEVEVTDVSYKATNDGLEIWLIAKPK